MNLECRNLSFKYPGSDRFVFRGLSFVLSTTGFHALFGSSGVGKSTLARLLAGKPALDTNGIGGGIERGRLQTILYSHNLERLPGWTTVRQHLQAVGSTPAPSGFERLIETFGLTECIDARFNQLSLGQQNRTNLARYLLQDFDMLIMDESLANVDEQTRRNIIGMIKHDFADKCFLYISHSIAEIARFCRQILVLSRSSRRSRLIDLQGQDQNAHADVDPGALEKTMLEMVRAS